MDGDSYDKQQYPVDAFVAVAVWFLAGDAIVKSREMMEMGSNLVEQTYERNAQRNTYQRLPPATFTGHFDGRHYETDERGGEHHAGAEAEEDVVPAVRDFFTARPMVEPSSDARPRPAAHIRI